MPIAAGQSEFVKAEAGQTQAGGSRTSAAESPGRLTTGPDTPAPCHETRLNHPCSVVHRPGAGGGNAAAQSRL